jgi:hypothetical protein
MLKHNETCGGCHCSRATQCDFLLRTGFEPHPDKSGGLNGSMQKLLKAFLTKSTRTISFAGVGSKENKGLSRF